jgi:hypothetical protein
MEMPNLIDRYGHNVKNVGIFIGLPTNRPLVPFDWMVAMGEQEYPGQFSRVQGIVKNEPIDVARNIIAEKALSIGAKYLWFVDDDTIPPHDALRKLTYILDNYPKIKAIGGIACTKTNPPLPTVFRGDGAGPFMHWKAGDIFEVTSIGACCLLINVDVLKELPQPWFAFTKGEVIEGVPIINNRNGEDIEFCKKVRAAGYHVFAHGGVICDHWDVDVNPPVIYRLQPDSFPYNQETMDLETVPTPELSNP